MATRITQKDLEMLLSRINEHFGFITPKYSEIGSFTLSCAYGGVSLHQNGCTRDVFSCGHISKRDLYNRMSSFLEGVESYFDIMERNEVDGGLE